MTKQSKVELKNLTKIFVTNKNKEVRAVDNIDLTINPGEFVCLLGPSGCGKTTTLRMLAGFEIASSGQIFVGERDVVHLTPDKRNTAMVFQNYALFPHMNVYDNISYGLKLKKIPKEQIKERVNTILGMMKMEEFSSRVPSQMSGGQQQRIALARALIMDTGVLLFDEPLSNLDAKLRLHMRDEIRKIQREMGITTIYVTHDQEEAMGLADRVVVMKDGTIQQSGPPRTVYQEPCNEFVARFIGRANIMRGRIVAVKENVVSLEVHGLTYEVKKTTKLSAGEEVSFMIRPESFKIGGSDFKALVTKSLFMGSRHEYEVDFFGKLLEISENNPIIKRTVNVGEELSFSMDPDSIHILS